MDHFKVALLIPVTVAVASAIWCYRKTNDMVGDALRLAGLVYSHPAFMFGLLFVWRYLRVFVHIVACWCLYKPSPIADMPKQTPRDCTVIIPTNAPPNPDFEECLESCLKNGPAEIIIVTTHEYTTVQYSRVIGPYQFAWPDTIIRVIASQATSKRAQIAVAITQVRTEFTILLDAHTIWPSTNFLPTALAPFENERTASVGVGEQIRYVGHGSNRYSFWNILSAISLERRNFELRATNTIDGGVSSISGRTSLHRSIVLQDPDFIRSYTTQHFVDDEHFITRWVFERDWEIKIQICDDARVEAMPTAYPTTMRQHIQQMRYLWRSNMHGLFTDRIAWRSRPWFVYAVYVTWITDIACFHVAALSYTLLRATVDNPEARCILLFCIPILELMELIPYILNYSIHMCIYPGYFWLALFHSILKLWAGLTRYDASADDRFPVCIENTTIPRNNNHQDTRNTYVTPWGKVTSPTPYTTPANILQNQYIPPPSSQKKGPLKTYPPTTRSQIREMKHTPLTPANTPAQPGPNLIPAPIDRPISIVSSPAETGPISSVGHTPVYSSAGTPVDSPLTHIDRYQPVECPVDWQKIVPAPFTPPTSPPPAIETGKRPKLGLSTPPSTGKLTCQTTPISHLSPSSSVPTASSSSTKSSDPLPATNAVYKRQWVRGPRCAKLHYDGRKLARNGGCRVESVWALPNHVLPDRPRM